MWLDTMHLVVPSIFKNLTRERQIFFSNSKMSLKSIFSEKAQSIDQRCYRPFIALSASASPVALTNLIGQCGFQCKIAEITIVLKF